MLETWQKGLMEALGEPVTGTTTGEEFKAVMSRHGFHVYRTLHTSMKSSFYDTRIEYDPYIRAIPVTQDDKEAIVAYADKTHSVTLTGKLREEAPRNGDIETMLSLHQQVAHITWDYPKGHLLIAKRPEGLLVTRYFDKPSVTTDSPPPEPLGYLSIEEILEQFPCLANDDWYVHPK